VHERVAGELERCLADIADPAPAAG
jgi:hypothetical protein